NQSMLKIVIGRTASMHGISVGKEMGNRFSDREAESRSTGTGEILLLIYGLAQVARKEMPAASPYPGHPLEVGYAVLPMEARPDCGRARLALPTSPMRSRRASTTSARARSRYASSRSCMSNTVNLATNSSGKLPKELLI